MNSPTCEATYNKVSIVFRIYRHNMQVHSFYICDKREREREVTPYEILIIFVVPLQIVTYVTYCYTIMREDESIYISIQKELNAFE